MPDLDQLVLDNLESRIFAPDRLEPRLRGLSDRARYKAANEGVRANELRKKPKATEAHIEPLYAALADGIVANTDTFRRSLSQIEAEREDALRNIGALESRREVPRRLLTKDNIAPFVAASRERLRAEDPTLRKAYVKQFIDRIRVDDEVRIIGPTANLAAAIRVAGFPPGVPSFVSGWWADRGKSGHWTTITKTKT